jgi:C-terminal processing protease CtpA/Prc
MSVWKNSPAAAAGVMAGDEIKSVNGEAATPMSTEQVSRRLHGAVGTRVNLTIKRDGKRSALTLGTRQMLCGHTSETPYGK